MKKFLPLLILLVIVICASAILVLTQFNKAASTTTPGTIPAPSIAADESGFMVSGGQGTPGSTNTSGLSQISLKITSPADGAAVNTSTLTVRGVTAPKADVFVNEAETTADAAGNFTARVTLDEGENYILVTVNDADGNAAEQEFSVTYQPAL